MFMWVMKVTTSQKSLHNPQMQVLYFFLQCPYLYILHDSLKTEFYYENNIPCYEPLDNQGHLLFTGKGNIHCHSSLIYAYLFSFHIYMIFIDVHIYLICRH